MTLVGKSLNQFQYSYEKDTVSVYGAFTVDGYGEPTMTQEGGVASVTKESAAGQYTVVLIDKFKRLLEVRATVVDDAASAVAEVQLFMDPATIQDDFNAGIVLQCLNYAGSAANLASGAGMQFVFVMRKTKVGQGCDSN